MENDSIIHAVCGNYILSAVSVAVEHCLAGRKAKTEYIKEPIMSRTYEEDVLTEEEKYEQEVKKALFAEEMWIRAGKEKNLPETIIR